MSDSGRILLAGIWAYPLKGAAGVELPRATLDPLGIPGDRRWMLAQEDGRFISQRTHPRLCLIRVTPEGDTPLSFTVDAPGMGSIQLCPPLASEERMQVQVHRDRFPAQPVEGEEAEWFSSFLGEPCRLVFFPDECIRPTDPAYAPGHKSSFADGYPLHLASEESLEDLNRAMGSTFRMLRFRPNLVVSGGEAWEEDAWRVLQIGTARVELVKPCARCSVTVVDPETGISGKEPLLTLSAVRRWEEKVYFGQNAVMGSLGSFETGDDVCILERGPHRPPLPAPVR